MARQDNWNSGGGRLGRLGAAGGSSNQEVYGFAAELVVPAGRGDRGSDSAGHDPPAHGRPINTEGACHFGS